MKGMGDEQELSSVEMEVPTELGAYVPDDVHVCLVEGWRCG